ncbi:MAG: RNA polymerase sigma factor [Actinobacteria bacterium]|nr:RNA polymerase sigma factor [Actinomycetota bacterium]
MSDEWREASRGRRPWRAQIEALRHDRNARNDLIDLIARRAASGDTAALEALIWAVDELRLARPAVRRLVVHEADADDVEQDVLVAVAENIGSFRGEARFATWVQAVARNKAIAHIRRRKATVALEGDDVGDAARISSMIATRTALDAVIRALPELYREAVVLRDIGRHSYAEVAEHLGLNLNTTKARVARGRALAAAHLSDQR